MRRLLPVLVLVVVATACSSSSDSSSPEPSSSTTTTTAAPVAVPPGTPTVLVGSEQVQRIDGFGASGAWWPNDLVRFPKEVQDKVAQLLFDADGIALSGYRYNVGGGGKGVTDPARAPKEFPDDEAGRIFLQAAASKNVPVLTGFVNSAPPQFTTNGKACGGQLKPGQEAAFAAYLVDIVRELHDDDITLHYVSPMNEPADSFGDCGQEGMQVAVEQRAPLVNALATALAKNAPYAKVIADETTADLILASEAPQWLPDAADNIAAIAHHTYDFPTNAIRKVVPPIAKKYGKPTWMTEACCYKGSGEGAQGFGAQYDPTMKQGFWLANQIHDDLTVAGDSAWYWWTALSPKLGCAPDSDACATSVNTEGFNDGLLYYDDRYPDAGVDTIFTTKRYSVMGHFSRYVRPGAFRHDVAGAKTPVMVFEHDDQWSVVTWNESKTEQTFVLEGLPADVMPSTAVQTNETDDLADAAVPGRTASRDWIVTVPAGTIATYTFGRTA